MGLGQLGLNAAGVPSTISQPSAQLPVGTDGAGQAEATAAFDALQEILAANQAVQAMLQANVREYEELTMFQRPIVKRMFQQGTGLKVEEWLSQSQAMSRQLETRLNSPVDGEGATLAGPKAITYVAQLKRLAEYILKQESEARGFFKNAETLNRVLVALRDRRAAVLRLVTLFESIHPQR